MTILCGSDLGDGLTVRNLRSKELNFKAELVVQAPLHNIDMLLSVAVENGLAKFLRVLYNDGRIL